MPIADAVLEEVLTYLRRSILLRFDPTSGSGVTAPGAEFSCALARQCFFSNYAFFADEDELQRVAIARLSIETALTQPVANPRALESPLTVFALYESLHMLRGNERLLEVPMSDWSDAFGPIVQEQLVNRRREHEIAARLPALTAIEDGVSLAVRAQYEENPYPRWVSVHQPPSETFEDLWRRFFPARPVRTRPRPIPILVAGCGSGRHPIRIAATFPDSAVLAVDLSLASLAYASRMTERFGIANITYGQADILKLGALDRRFAIVESVGVLHHLHDPMEGWRVLVDLMEPDGLMRIGLYSETARSGIRAAREYLASLGLPETPEGIRRGRHAIIALPEGHPAKSVMKISDFFGLDECRDLLMHVQEHRFTLPRIADCLDDLGLRFLGFECTTETTDSFRQMFPDNLAATNLEAWHRFETANPATFTGMYNFWCCRKEVHASGSPT
jgi:SAM-dependent methyltransferase